MGNLQLENTKGRSNQIGNEIKWLGLAFVLLVMIFIGIKLSVYSFLNIVSEGYLTSSRYEVRGYSSQGTPDEILTPVDKGNGAYHWQSLPDQIPIPFDNPLTEAKVILGEVLFNDPNLSRDRTLSCASCHDLYAKAGTDASQFSTGINGQLGERNAPTVWNTAYQTRFFWDGRAHSLEEQAVQPFLNSAEMGMSSIAAIEQRVQEQPKYRTLFADAYDGSEEINIEKIAKAIASFERTLITADSPYDEFVNGDKDALSKQQLNGMVLFEKSGCIHCHFGPNFSAASVFNQGLELRIFPANSGEFTSRYALGDRGDEQKVWRVPSLRNVALTGPWFHNGAVDDLHEVVRIMSKAQLGKTAEKQFQWSEHSLGVIENPELTEAQLEDIVAFLHALSSKKLAAARKERQN